ncbi:MAG: response regulator transcription factor, partial [Thermoleophilaceae bacterium]|nr:response regulator transcription factor [Thermoleophilaceae bacterium]
MVVGFRFHENRLTATHPIVGQNPASHEQSFVKASVKPQANALFAPLGCSYLAQKTRILLVEDEASISEPLTAALEREGFEVVVARTAAEAQTFELGIDPDVVLLDLMLPDGDGRDVCRVIRGHSDVPIIMLTARGTETDKIVGLEIGADDYMVKPFSSGELVARIRALLRRT